MPERADFKTRFSSANQPVRNGRPKGTRDKINTEFLGDLADAWHEHGKQALIATATSKPEVFCAIVARLQPSEVVHTTPESELSEEQMAEMLELMRAELERRRTKMEELNGDGAQRIN